MTAPDPDLSPANYPADNPPVDLDGVVRRRRPPRGPALLAHAGRAVTRRRCDWCDDDATTRLSGEGWSDEACDRHADQWAQGRTRTPIGGDGG